MGVVGEERLRGIFRKKVFSPFSPWSSESSLQDEVGGHTAKIREIQNQGRKDDQDGPSPELFDVLQQTASDEAGASAG